LRPCSPKPKLTSEGGWGRHRFLPFPLSQERPKENGCQAAHVPACRYAGISARTSQQSNLAGSKMKGRRLSVEDRHEDHGKETRSPKARKPPGARLMLPRSSATREISGHDTGMRVTSTAS
jgi:hypothetical protein